MLTEQAPIKVEACGNFTGNDGAWSCVKVRVGSPPQEVEVFPSTEIQETWVVLKTACFNTSSNCTDLRGGVFNPSNSSTWAPKGGLFELGAEDNLGFTTNQGPDADIGLFGFDTLGLDVPGGNNISLKQQVVVGLNTTHFYRGNLGLASRPIVFGDTTTSPSFLQSLKDFGLIPSLSYGLTAGASYLQSAASLTLGGYDSARFRPNDITFTLASTSVRELVVGIKSIVSTDSTGKEISLLTDSILTLVDSTVPHIWLPSQACQAFEAAFGISYNPISNLYLVNDTLHETLKKRNASIIFEISNEISNNGKDDPAVNITLPYASFDLEVQEGYPLVTKTSKYFPLRQARDDSQYTLGRTFLQESYLIVNYETKNFSISQAIAAPDSGSKIVAISTNDTTAPTTTDLPPAGTPKPSKSHSLSTGAIAGIAIAIVLVVLIVGGGLLFLNLKKRRGRTKKSNVELDANPPPPRGRAELPGDRLSGSTMEKGAVINDDEVPHKDQEHIDQQEVGLMKGETAELSGPEVSRSELPSPDPNAKHELATPDLPPRSELSTPEPTWPIPEIMPSPEPRAEMSSEALRKSTAEDASPEIVSSPVSSPDPERPRNRAGSQRRPVHIRVDSSESEGGWTRAPTRTRPSLRNPRVVSSESEGGWTRDGFTHHRVDSSDSEISSPRTNVTSIRPPHNRNPSSDSEPISPEQAPSSATSSRPAHRRLDSNDSGDTLETRMELPPGSPFFPPSRHYPPIQALPSIGPEESLSPLSSPVPMSIRSGLRSPEPLDIDEKSETETLDAQERH